MFKETPQKKIISQQNPIIKHLVKLRLDSRYRKEQSSVVVSGYKVVEELKSLISPTRIFTEKDYPAPHTLVSDSVMKKITGLTSPEGIAAEFPLPKEAKMLKGPILALDRINDPGNMGTLIRTALAFGWGGVFFLPGCVDPFHEKVIRASRGALFRFPWKEGTWGELKERGFTTFIADIKGRSLDEVAPQRDIILVLSNEAQGVSEEGASFGEKITIPMRGEMESLNVAVSGGIMMYKLGNGVG